MSYRQFTDDAGREWSVFDVNPAADDRRGGERRQAGDSTESSDERRVEDRRLTFRSSRPVRLRQGWLCFETEGERRRLQPIPEGWAHLPENELRALLLEARDAPRRAVSGAGFSRTGEQEHREQRAGDGEPGSR